ncbi:tetratricopeptide repeat protein [Pedobacter sp.]|uniref:tetratricopeptide repeat protein n=1 Tax=Pedobacter sp. TaxID=1411316 RepID=UPI002C71ED93|nr:tetratricopeptide repeat protein [Pedobacter sp.]HWW43204.1 tetratricopeptide repeat protein [Pedobacter sp.]
MKNRILMVLLLVLPLFSAANEQVKDLFTKGNVEYAKGQYREAAEIYQQVLKMGYLSAAANFNLGNAYYKQGEFAAARSCYEKAHQLAPADRDIELNLQLSRLKSGDKTEHLPELFFVRWWKGLVFLLSFSFLSIWSVLCFLGGFAVLIYYLYAGSVSLKKAAFYAGISMVVVGLVFMLFAGVQTHFFLNP